jgi:hypothetical protein
MTQQSTKDDLKEITDLFTTAQSTFSMLEYLYMTIHGVEGYIITNNAFLRTSIFSNWRVTVLELSKLFPDTKNDNNNHFSIRLFIDKLKTTSDDFTPAEIASLENGDNNLRNEKTRAGENIVTSIRSQRDTKIAHTDKGRFKTPDGLTMENLFTMLHGCDGIVSFLNKKINGGDFSRINITEPVGNLKAMVEQLAEIKRKELYQKLEDAKAKGISPEEDGVDVELIKEDRRDTIFKKIGIR